LGAELSVRVWGIDARERIFSQKAQARDVTETSATLFGLDRSLTVGNVIGLQLGELRVRCKIASIVDAAAREPNEFCLELIEGQPCPWQEFLPGDPRIQEQSGERRRSIRHKLSVPIELMSQGSTGPLRVTSTDMSGNGCYLETVFPLPKGTGLQVGIWIGSRKVSTSAVVRTCDGGVGMGIEFIGLSKERREKLEQYLEEMVTRELSFPVRL
jgi:PilZ domain